MSVIQPPMIGTWEVQVHSVRPFTIHSDLYYELHVTRLEQPDQGLAIRVPQHAAATEPKAGDRVVLTFLMGQVTQVKRMTPTE